MNFATVIIESGLGFKSKLIPKYSFTMNSMLIKNPTDMKNSLHESLASRIAARIKKSVMHFWELLSMMLGITYNYADCYTSRVRLTDHSTQMVSQTAMYSKRWGRTRTLAMLFVGANLYFSDNSHDTSLPGASESNQTGKTTSFHFTQPTQDTYLN